MNYPFQAPYHYPQMSPLQQGALRAAEHVIITTAVTLLGTVFVSLLQVIGQQAIDYRAVGIIFGVGLLLSLGAGVAAYLTALGSPYGSIIGQAIADVEPLLKQEIEHFQSLSRSQLINAMQSSSTASNVIPPPVPAPNEK